MIKRYSDGYISSCRNDGHIFGWWDYENRDELGRVKYATWHVQEKTEEQIRKEKEQDELFLKSEPVLKKLSKRDTFYTRGNRAFFNAGFRTLNDIREALTEVPPREFLRLKRMGKLTYIWWCDFLGIKSTLEKGKKKYHCPCCNTKLFIVNRNLTDKV